MLEIFNGDGLGVTRVEARDPARDLVAPSVGYWFAVFGFELRPKPIEDFDTLDRIEFEELSQEPVDVRAHAHSIAHQRCWGATTPSVSIMRLGGPIRRCDSQGWGFRGVPSRRRRDDLLAPTQQCDVSSLFSLREDGFRVGRGRLVDGMDHDRVRELYNSCNPAESLSVNDPRNVDLDNMANGNVRGSIWARKMAREFELSDSFVCKLFSGLPGSGKSTELQRLLFNLSDKGFLSVLIDADREIDLTGPIDAPEIVAVVVSAVEKAILEREGKDPEDALKNGYASRLWNFITNTDIDFKGMVASKGPVKLTAELKTNPMLRQRFREILAPRLSQFLGEAREYVEGLQERARKLEFKGIVVAFDSLEKLRGMSESWDAVVDSAERVFARGAEHVRLPVHTVYTVPTALLSRQLDIEFMPAVKVRERDGGEYVPGVNALHELIRRRISDEEREELFGSGRQQVDLLNRLIHDSGGYLRSLVSALRDIVAEENHPVTGEFIDALFQRRVDEYKRIVTKADHDFLVSIRAEKELTLPDSSAQSRRMAEHLLANNVVLRYQNANDWFDLHPAVKKVPGLRDRLGAGEA
ncbi:MAG: hypothetical protein AAGF11_25290 [Myxococcota bacterium]